MAGKRGGYLVLKIHLLNGRLFNRLLSRDKRARYKAEQGKILSALWDHEPQTMIELAGVTGLAKSSLSAMLKRLEEQELVTSWQDEADKRKRYVKTTELGAKQRAVGEAVSKELSQIFYKGFSKEEIIDCEAYLARILDNLETAEAELAQ